MLEIILTDQNFEQEVLKSEKPVLVDMYSEWCPPCKIISPFLEKIAEEFSEKIKVGKMNVEQSPLTASQYGIEVIPTLLFFKNGKVIDKIVGAVPYKVLEERVKQNL
ncbi:thioredoxin [bacterium]|nr:thioredoxin [bacterium]